MKNLKQIENRRVAQNRQQVNRRNVINFPPQESAEFTMPKLDSLLDFIKAMVNEFLRAPLTNTLLLCLIALLFVGIMILPGLFK